MLLEMAGAVRMACATYHVVLALAMSSYRVIAGPEEEVWLAFVVLHLEIVYFAIFMVWSPY